ncbi:hypothetical protein [Collimonas humicola]|uniref:hypothetical protein n=1 Tax=Collimonas humicola TaxID=2825886 RepID=UPI001B8D32C2|nr:hypothetical protein [Collimonas humicola]
MKCHFLAIVAALILMPALSGAAPAGHDFSSRFKACYAAAGSDESKSACLAEELDLQNKAVADAHQAAVQALTGAGRQKLTDDFVEWKKSILLDCSLQADSQKVAVARENARKYCLIERSLAHRDADEVIRQDKTLNR